MRIAIYSHAGSKNHGCEALVRTIIPQLGHGNTIDLYSLHKEEDVKYGIDKIVNKIIQPCFIPYSWEHIKAFVKSKMLKDEWAYFKATYKEMFNGNYDYAISIGGDNYCYEEQSVWLDVLNSELIKKKCKTILWGCSIEPQLFNEELVRELKKYHLIFARESITYEMLKNHGINAELYPDTAFALPIQETDMPKGFQLRNTLGINISPLVEKKENYSDAVVNNISNVINYVLNKTDMTVALFPHVVWEHDNDFELLRRIYETYKCNERVMIVQDCNCMQLKHIISKCRFLITARTHASIAAYSSMIPTIVVGYSVKSKGIAKDIFGTYENYVLPIEDIVDDNSLLDSFVWCQKHEQEIRAVLGIEIPKIKDKLEDMGIKE